MRKHVGKKRNDGDLSYIRVSLFGFGGTNYTFLANHLFENLYISARELVFVFHKLEIGMRIDKFQLSFLNLSY